MARQFDLQSLKGLGLKSGISVDADSDGDERGNSIDEQKRRQDARGLLRTSKQAQQVRGLGRPGEVDGVMDDSVAGMVDTIPHSKQFNLNALKRPSNVPALGLYGPEIDAITGPVKQPTEGWGMKTLDFLFGSEAAVIGIAHDSEGWSWSVENMQQQWSEQPLWVNLLGTASLVGTLAFPAARALSMSAKFGALATKTARYGGEAAEIAKWKEAGRISDDVASYAQLGDVGSDGSKAVELLRKQDYALSRYSDMAKRADAVSRGETTWASSPVARMQHAFDKRFANNYNDAVDLLGTGSARGKYHRTLDDMWKSDEIGQILGNLPDNAAMPKIQAYMMGRIDPTLAGRAVKEFGKLSTTDRKFADFYYDAAKVQQQKMLDDGIISAKEFKAMGEIHLPALSEGTHMPLTKTQSYLLPTGAAKAGDTAKKVAVELHELPTLTSATLLRRRKTTTEAFEALKKGELVTGAHQMTANGYMTDRLLHHNFTFIRDMVMDENNIADAASIAAWGGSAEKALAAGFVSLDDIGANAAGRLQRMIAKKSGGAVEDLPWIRTHVFDEIFGDAGMMNQARAAGGNMMNVATAIYKTMKTSGNIPTHLQNLTGNLVFLSQAGFDVTRPQNVALLSKMTESFLSIADAKSAAKALNRGEEGAELLARSEVRLGSYKINGRTFDLDEELTSDIVRELIEESAFDMVEGSGKLADIAAGLQESQYATKGVINAYAKVKKFAQAGDRVKWFDNLTKAYLAEDMVPKMAYFMHLRGQGLTQKAAAIEVARRLPMYNTVGSAIKHGRKMLFPWATFPAEAMRITKNNIMDHPLRMMPWLRAPQITQSMASAMGMGPGTREEAEAAESQLPTWAQKGTTVMMDAKSAAFVGGAGTGSVLGAAAGAVIGKGAGGVAAGAAVGGAFGTMLAALTTDDESADTLRGALLDFLPHSTFMMSNTSKDFGGQVVPFQDLQGLQEQLPAEPLAILKPLTDVLAGQDAFGNPVGDGTLGGGLAKTIAGAIGFISPPIVQKYGFKTTLPDDPWPGDFAGVTNMTRGLIDTGMMIDPNTGKPGNFGHDFLLNNVSAWKTYEARGSQQLANESITERKLSVVRSALSKNLAYHLQNENDKEVIDILSSIQGTYAQQYIHDPQMANTKYYEWLERHQGQLGRHPKLRNWSEEELTDRLRMAGSAAGTARGAARENLMQALRDELKVRGVGGLSVGGGGMGKGMSGGLTGGMKGGLGT